MKIPKNTTSAASSEVSVDPIVNGFDPRPPQSERGTRHGALGFDGEIREALSKHLHELLNSLWPAAARIELAISEKSCPPKFRETLEQIGRCVEEAMTIAARASEQVDSPTSKRISP